MVASEKGFERYATAGSERRSRAAQLQISVNYTSGGVRNKEDNCE